MRIIPRQALLHLLPPLRLHHTQIQGHLKTAIQLHQAPTTRMISALHVQRKIGEWFSLANLACLSQVTFTSTGDCIHIQVWVCKCRYPSLSIQVYVSKCLTWTNTWNGDNYPLSEKRTRRTLYNTSGLLGNTPSVGKFPGFQPLPRPQQKHGTSLFLLIWFLRT